MPPLDLLTEGIPRRPRPRPQHASRSATLFSWVGSACVMHEVDRAIADSEETGFVKIHVREGTDTILGTPLLRSRQTGSDSIVRLHLRDDLAIGHLVFGLNGNNPAGLVLLLQPGVQFVLCLSGPKHQQLSVVA